MDQSTTDNNTVHTEVPLPNDGATFGTATPRTIRVAARRILQSANQAGNNIAAATVDDSTSNLVTTVEDEQPSANNTSPTATSSTLGSCHDPSSSSVLLMTFQQVVASILLALVPILYLLGMGIFLSTVVSPTKLLRLVEHGCHNQQPRDDSSDIVNMTLVRLVGCVFLGQAVSCMSLVFPLIHKTLVGGRSSSPQQQQHPSSSVVIVLTTHPKDVVALDKFRSALVSLSIMGLFALLAGLWGDFYPTTAEQDSDTTSMLAWLVGGNLQSSCQVLPSILMIASGGIMLVCASLSAMITFWPLRIEETALLDNNNNNNNTYIRSSPAGRVRGDPRSATMDNDDALQVPLLSLQQEDVYHDAEEEMLQHHVEQADTARDTSQAAGRVPSTVDEEMANNSRSSDSTNHGHHGDDEPTSRIRGTKRLLSLAAPQVFYLYVGCAVLLLRLPFSLCIPHFVSTTLGAVSRGDFTDARTDILRLFILGTIDAALDFWCVFLFGFANQRIVRGVRINTFVSILRQEVAFFDSTTSGELASRLNSDCGEMAGDLTWFFRFSIESVVRITGIVSYMLIRCPILGCSAITIIPVVALVNKLYGNWLNQNAKEVQDALAAANQVAQETFTCIRTVIAFASEQQEHKKYKECIDRQYHLNVRQLYISGVYYMVISTFLINTVVQASLLFIGTALIQHGRLTGEILLAFMLYQGQLQNETMNLFQSYTSLVKSSGAGDKVFSLLDRHPEAPGTGCQAVASSEVGEASLVLPSAAKQTAGQSSCSVAIKDVSFAYPSRPDNPVLKHFNLKVPAGKTIALVGSSGCGKSTVVGLLQRFYDPSIGTIRVDNNDLRTLDIKDHRRRVGTVTQNPILFKGTIMFNITYGCPSATRPEVIEAARLANALEFINSFPDGFDTDVGERGTQLSGGQMQRIAIARAIIKKPALLLLDEATSALDAVSERAVQEALDKLLKTNNSMTTTVVVAHRLQTVRNADMIAYVENGRVAEIGSHEELMEIPLGNYRRMVERAGSDGQLPDQC